MLEKETNKEDRDFNCNDLEQPAPQMRQYYFMEKARRLVKSTVGNRGTLTFHVDLWLSDERREFGETDRGKADRICGREERIRQIL